MEYKLIQSKRKSISIEVKSDLSVIVRAPIRMSKREIEKFVLSRSEWVERAKDKIRQRKSNSESKPGLSEDEIKELARKASRIIPEKVALYAPIVGVDYGRITIRNQATRWGSCSSKGNLNFNCRLMLMSDEIIDYVVVHELCHRLQMNHSAKFWAEVERVLPDYKVRRKALKEYAID